MRENLWANSILQGSRTLYCRRREATIERNMDWAESYERMVPYLQQAGFYGVSLLPFVQLDWGLITALVERWRPETHTFHMPVGEVTITLQDVAIQFGLPVDGNAVVGVTMMNWRDECERLLGVRPAANDMKGGRVNMQWLQNHFTSIPAGADDVTVQQCTRGYILLLIGGFVFADRSSSHVPVYYLPLFEDFAIAGQYSWGSACLSYLYRNLCRASQTDISEIAGALILVQIWAWDRFPSIAPVRRYDAWVNDSPLACRWEGPFDVRQLSTHVITTYRYAFDTLTPDQVCFVHSNLCYFLVSTSLYDLVLCRLYGHHIRRNCVLLYPIFARLVATYGCLACPLYALRL